jgi:hypothetical protein
MHVGQVSALECACEKRLTRDTEKLPCKTWKRTKPQGHRQRQRETELERGPKLERWEQRQTERRKHGRSGEVQPAEQRQRLSCGSWAPSCHHLWSVLLSLPHTCAPGEPSCIITWSPLEAESHPIYSALLVKAELLCEWRCPWVLPERPGHPL